MKYHRLTYKNGQVFEVAIDLNGQPTAREDACRALIYRVTDGIREPSPVHRLDGHVIDIAAPNERAVLQRIGEELEVLTGSRLSGVIAG